MLRRRIVIAAIIATALVLSGCGTINSFLAEKTADYLPASMGGLPADAPPRPSDPRYPEWERAQREKAIKTEPAEEGGKP